MNNMCDICGQNIKESGDHQTWFYKEINLNICGSCRQRLYNHPLLKQYRDFGIDVVKRICHKLREHPEILFFINFSKE